MQKTKQFIRNSWWAILLIFFILLSLTLAGFAIVSFWTQFKDSTISNDTQKWADFGNYFGGTLSTLFVLINVCVTIWLTITVNKFTKKNSDRQIEAEKKIATIQLRHEALKEFRNDLDKNYSVWKDNIYSPESGWACERSVINFSSHYSYLFDTETTISCHDFARQVNSILSALIDGDRTKTEELFNQILLKKITLYSLIGRKIIQ